LTGPTGVTTVPFSAWRESRGEAEARERRERKAVVNCIVMAVV